MLLGIYIIVNKNNGKKYVGSSKNLYDRWEAHLFLLRRGIHHSPHFQYAFNKDGEDSFEFIIMEEVKDKNQLVPREQTWLDYYKSYLSENGYNICKIAGSRLGSFHTKETKYKMSESQIGKLHSEISKEKMMLSKLGIPRSEKTRLRISLSMRGKTHSEEARRRMSLSMRGEKAPHWSKKFSEETRERMSLASKGKPKSEEHKAKMKVAWIKRKEKKGLAA